MKREKPMSIKTSQPLKVFGAIALNYDEINCLNLAWYFLKEQCNADTPESIFRSLPDHELRYLKIWLDQPVLMSKLHFDTKHRVNWPVKTLECGRLLKWLALALGWGIPEDTINAVAADEANIERDQVILNRETCERSTAILDAEFMNHFRALQAYYGQVAQLSNTLIKKLKPILKKVEFLNVSDDQADFLSRCLA